MEKNYTVTSETELEDVAGDILKTFPTERVFALYGSMGAGKTTFVKAIGKVLAVTDTVSSPTFSLVNQYMITSGSVMYHFDLYRIEKISELYDIGYEEYLYSGFYCFLEWPERMMELLPQEYVSINIDVGEDGKRQFRVKKIS